MKYLVAALLFVSGPASAAVVGRFDWTSLPSFGGWQSVENADQATGLSKHVWSLSKDSQELVRVGVFAGVSKPMLSEPGAPIRFLAGNTVALPGSLLDWALGTKMGESWLPRLKTGVLAAYDLSRLGQLHARPNFIGVGVAYPLGGGQ